MANTKTIRPSGALLLCGLSTSLIPPVFASDPSLQKGPNSTSFDLSAISKGILWPIANGSASSILASASGYWVINGSQLAEYSLDGRLISNLALGAEAFTLCRLSKTDLLIGYANSIELYNQQSKTRRLWADLGSGANITAIVKQASSIYVADSQQKMVMRFSPHGALANIIGAKQGHFVVPSAYFDIAPGPEDSVWITNPGRHRLERYSPQGQLLEQFGTASDNPAGFAGCCNPIGILALANGSLVTREKGLQRLKLYDSHGGFQKVLAGPESFMHRPLSPAMGLFQNQLFYFDGPILKTIDLQGRPRS